MCPYVYSYQTLIVQIEATMTHYTNYIPYVCVNTFTIVSTHIVFIHNVT